MKSIKLGSAAVNTTKPFIIAMPTVVKPAVVRNVALDLRAVEKNNPNTGICITDKKMEAMPENLKDKLASMEGSNYISVETLFNPEEYFNSGVENFLTDLFPSGISSVEDLSNITADFSIASTLSFVAASGYMHRDNKRIDIPVVWELHGPDSSDSEIVSDVISNNSGVPSVVDTTVVTALAVDKNDPVYNISITQPSSSNYSFDLVATLQMSMAELYAESDSVTSTSENDNVVSDWNASYTFHITIAKGS